MGEHGTGPPLLLLLETPLELPLLMPPELLPLPPEELLLPPPEELLPVTPLELPVEPPEPPLLPGPASPTYSMALPPQPEAAKARQREKPRKRAPRGREVRTAPTKSERRASDNPAGSRGWPRAAGVSR